MEMKKLKEQIAGAKAPHVRGIGEILLRLGAQSDRIAELVEQDLENKAMSLEACGKSLYEFARKNQKGGSWACAVLEIEPENPVIQIILDFYKIPSAWVFEDAGKVPEKPAQPSAPVDDVINLMDLL